MRASKKTTSGGMTPHLAQPSPSVAHRQQAPGACGAAARRRLPAWRLITPRPRVNGQFVLLGVALTHPPHLKVMGEKVGGDHKIGVCVFPFWCLFVAFCRGASSKWPLTLT